MTIFAPTCFDPPGLSSGNSEDPYLVAFKIENIYKIIW